MVKSIQADLRWQDGLPYSRQFEDVYFSVSPQDPQHGLSETRHVFLQHNALATRWASLSACNPTHFTLLETGFGSGLNFLAAVECWLAHAPSSAHLHVVSIEIAPFSHADLQRALNHFPTLAAFSEALLQQYHLLHTGFNQFEFPDWRVSLTLIVGDVATWLPQLNASVDAWFLDGFAPSKNPDMWSDALFSQMARLSAAGASFATFTSAGKVRRGLQAVGFTVQKVTGYGAKREMLCGHWPHAEGNISTKKSTDSPFTVAVIGAGIAGASTAWHLAQLGVQVTVFERQVAPAMGASGNPYGMLYPRLNTEKVLNDTLALHSYAYTLRHYGRLLSANDFQACGLLQLGGNPREYKRVQKVAHHYAELGWFQSVSPEFASQSAGVAIAHQALYFPEGAWVNPAAACRALLQHPNITLCMTHDITRLTHTAQGWQCEAQAAPSSPQADRLFQAVVVANAVDARRLLPQLAQAIKPIGGQMTMIKAEDDTQQLAHIICGDGYLTPAIGGQHALGATFHPRQESLAVTPEDNQANLAMMQTLSPQFEAAHRLDVTFARASLRCGTPDYLPYVGAVTNAERCPQTDAPAESVSGLFCHVGHGSKGLLTAPYCAALLARRILHSVGVAVPQVGEDRLWQGLHPLRHGLQSENKATTHTIKTTLPAPM